MPIDPFRTVAIVEEKRPFFLEGIDIFNTQIAAVHTRTIIAEEAIQFLKAPLPLFLVEMDKPIVGLLKSMSLSFKRGMDLTIYEAFAGKNERDIVLLIEENLVRRKGIFVRDPARIYANTWRRVPS